LFFVACLAGGFINVPVWREERREPEPPVAPFFFFYFPPPVERRVVCVNVGGALLPTALALYLLPRADLPAAMLATAGVTVVAKVLARPRHGVGLVLPVFVPPLAAAFLALVLAPGRPAPVAYVAGVLGTLVGADLLNLGRLREVGGRMVSIGGAGVFDGVFMVGVVAAFLS
ncbi:MAG: DUF1614 domain-containing protein, partial [Clostridia bacterium]|nr:DUF1614 domain-containing protein [Clostridia bacterium]